MPPKTGSPAMSIPGRQPARKSSRRGDFLEYGVRPAARPLRANGGILSYPNERVTAPALPSAKQKTGPKFAIRLI